MSKFSEAVRQEVHMRAAGRCEYCCKQEQYSPYAFHIDHIIPLKRHNGSNELDNLAWACFDCNTNKSGDIAGYENGELIPLFNPRKQQWNDHFEWDGAVLVGKTPIGLVTIRLLQLNHPDRIEIRRELMEADIW